MTRLIELENIPNQSFNIVVEQDSYDITIRTIGELTYVSITRNSEVILSNARAMPNQNIILSTYLFQTFGNFRFISSNNEEYPYYQNFGVSTFFHYVTKAEVVDASS